MNHHSLREMAKFFSGLVAGDFLAGVWLWSSGMLPITLLGITFDSTMILPWLIFDAALFIILVHYGWHMGKTPMLRERSYLTVAGLVFGIISFAHLVRVFTGADIEIIGWSVPLWLSWIGTAATAYLSYMSFRLALKMKHR